MKQLIKLVPVSLTHLYYIMNWINDPNVRQNFTAFTGTTTEDEEKAFLEKLVLSKTDRVFSVFDEMSKVYIGQVGINQIYAPAKVGRLSIIIVNDQQGKGYGKAALAAIINYAFRELKLNKLWLVFLEENNRARELYKKFAFKKEGLLEDEYIVNGKFHNMERMRLFAREYL
ncbi:MAG: GNAT family N-acetyltransferase [Candidatus Vogelbacteria bacterium]|nr:GNAT family N-acetyltransferase [Candidatus Vogelbacteria bacterium]